MKSSKPILLFLLAFSQLAFSQAPTNLPGAPANSTQVSGRKPVENYREVLAEIPAGLSRSRAEKWTKAKQEVANAALKKGDSVTLKGTLSHVAFQDLWDKLTLPISLKDCTFTK